MHKAVVLGFGLKDYCSNFSVSKMATRSHTAAVGLYCIHEPCSRTIYISQSRNSADSVKGKTIAGKRLDFYLEHKVILRKKQRICNTHAKLDIKDIKINPKCVLPKSMSLLEEILSEMSDRVRILQSKNTSKYLSFENIDNNSCKIICGLSKDAITQV